MRLSLVFVHGFLAEDTRGDRVDPDVVSDRKTKIVNRVRSGKLVGLIRTACRDSKLIHISQPTPLSSNLTDTHAEFENMLHKRRVNTEATMCILRRYSTWKIQCYWSRDSRAVGELILDGFFDKYCSHTLQLLLHNIHVT